MNVSSYLTGKSRQLDGRVAPDESITEADAADAGKLARLLKRILRDLASLKARFYPKRTDFEDCAVGASTTHRFPHGFNGRVRWWVIDQIGGGGSPASLAKNDATDRNTLVLDSTVACTITLRVEEAG